MLIFIRQSISANVERSVHMLKKYIGLNCKVLFVPSMCTKLMICDINKLYCLTKTLSSVVN